MPAILRKTPPTIRLRKLGGSKILIPEEELVASDSVYSRNEAEQAVINLLKKKGYHTIAKRGWPDLIAIDWNTGVVQFIEVKWVNQKLKAPQRLMQRIFEARGLKYKVARVQVGEDGLEVKSVKVEPL